MNRETPRGPDGERLCEHCLETPVPPSLGTKPKRYCSRNCRQRAYETRKQLKVVSAAVAAAEARLATSRDEPEATSRDVAKPAGTSRDVAPPPTPWRPKTQVKPRTVPAPAPPPAPPLWEDDDMADRLARYGISDDGQELPARD
ncbi:hypothetical protein JHN49_02245 [Streptomyces sp. MBT57]|nr:hypothetical protein [Streptomyces sp. MBT57]